MKKIITFCSGMGFVVSLLGTVAVAKDFKDATGTVVHLPEHPNRIVALAPAIAELAAEFLEVDLQRIVGVSDGTNFPPGLQSVQSIGPYQRINLEQVAALKPDLVLATFQGNAKDQVLHLRELGLPVFAFNTESFSDVEVAMLQMANILGVPARGLEVAARFKKSLDEVKARGVEHAKKNKKRVLIQLDDEPLIVAGGKSFLSEALAAVGAKNVYADSTLGYPRPSKEDVLKRNPDTILILAFGSDVKPFGKMAAEWSKFPGLAANKKKQITVIYADALLRPSLRVLEGLAVLEKTLYGAN